MKKSIFVLAACALSACLFSSCALKANEAYYDNLNEIIGQSYSEISLKVTNTFDEESKLVSDFVVTYGDNQAKVTYSVEELLPVSIEEANDWKKTTAGTVLVVNGEITQVDGEAAQFPFEQLTDVGLNFSSEYFSDVQLNAGMFSGTVTSPAAFFGVESFSAKDMKVYVSYTDVCQYIMVNFTALDGSAVKYFYQFRA